MKICICSSLTFTDEVHEIAKMLEQMGYEVLLPNGIINRLIESPNFDPIQTKIDTDSNHKHIDKIRSADAVLMCNFLKNCTPGYIGANCFNELFMAHYFNKPIFALFPLPDMEYIRDEIHSLGIEVIHNDFSRLPMPIIAPAEPIVESVAPIVDSVLPIVEPAAPVIESAVPAAEPIAPIAESAAPAAEPIAPIVEPAAPAAEPIIPPAPIVPPMPTIEPIAPSVSSAPNAAMAMSTEASNPSLIAEPAFPPMPAEPAPSIAEPALPTLPPIPEAPALNLPPATEEHSVFSSPADLGIEEPKPLSESIKNALTKIGGGLKRFANFCSGKKSD